MNFTKKESGSEGELKDKNVTDEAGQSEKKAFPASKRLILGGAAVIMLLALVWIGIGFMGGSAKEKSELPDTVQKTEPSKTLPSQPGAQSTNTAKPPVPVVKPPVLDAQTGAKKEPVSGHGSVAQLPVRPGEEVGVIFMEACIAPLHYELYERFWGWRPNDIVNITDNVGNYQNGVLEVTRRTAMVLAENLSRTGSTEAYVPALERAMSWFMVKSTQLWFPSAESKYKDGLNEFKNYMEMLQKKEARFYRRVDTAIPLFRVYESILGSCDENMIKELGSMNFTRSDDYFYYTKGVANAMLTILEAAAVEFETVIEIAQGTNEMKHAIISLQHAAHIDPWVVMEGKPGSLIANHRSNMAAPISHARFYLGILNRALSGNVQ